MAAPSRSGPSTASRLYAASAAARRVAFQGGGGPGRGQWVVGGQCGETCLDLVEEGREVDRQGNRSGLYVGDVCVPVSFRAAVSNRYGFRRSTASRPSGRGVPRRPHEHAPRISVATGAPSVPSQTYQSVL
ncbi:hypothetical protein AADR41_00790 [Streptomyces sp. CLV115]|uniref:hypothetical protein n=1 Tax=Streptomyces sp. CLV115 TaxID=3138502 RepID=UPI00313B4870